MTPNKVKAIVKAILFLVLVILFLVFYFIHQAEEFMKGSTTFTSRNEKVLDFEMPSLVLCFDPPFKASIFGNKSKNLNGLLTSNDVLNDSFNEFFENATYKLDKDFYMELSINDQDFLDKTLNIIHEGVNNIDDIQINVSATKTSSHGTCQLLESDTKLNPSQGIQVKIFAAIQSDIPKSLRVYVMAKESWYGVVAETWPYLKPSEVTFHFNTSTLFWINLDVAQLTFKEGHKSIPDCMQNIASKFNCNSMCAPIFLSFLKTWPPCQTLDETRCMFDAWVHSFYSQYKNCLKPQKTTIYKTNVVNLEDSFQPRGSVEIGLTFSSDEMEVKEETLMIGLSSFIGSIGGSLGLFLGFSFYTLFSDLIDKLFENFIKKRTTINP